MRRFIWPSVALALVIVYPLVFTTPFQQRLGTLILLYAIAASAWNIVGGYAGQISVGHVVFFGCGAYASRRRMRISRCRRWSAFPPAFLSAC